MTTVHRVVSGLLALAAATAVQARCPPCSPMQLNIEPQSVDRALTEWAAKTGYQVLIPGEAAESEAAAPALHGVYTPEDALKVLLARSELQYRFVNSRTVAIRVAQAAPRRDTDTPAATQAAAPARDSRSTGMEEVVVTATRREERAQDIPLSIAVIGGQDIERRGLTGMGDYLRSVPGVSQIDRGLDNAIVIRGITTSPQSENFNSGSTVATYFDETPITGAAGLGTGGIDVRPVDMARIEVLRGPQGTTFGSSSLGGALRLIPAKPDVRGFSGKVAASFSGTSGEGGEGSMVQGVANIPLVLDKLAIRAVGYRYDDTGFYKNVAGNDAATIAAAQRYGLGSYVSGYTQDDVGHMVSTGGRLGALWQATDALSLSMNFLTQTIEQDGRPEADAGTFSQIRVPVAPQGRVRGEEGEVNDSKIHLVNLVLNYDLAWGALTTAVSRVDGSSVYAFVNGAGTALGPSSSTGPSNFRSITAESRFTSRLDGPFQFLAGLYYEDVHDRLDQTYDWPAAATSNPFGTNPIFIVSAHRNRDQKAVFGELSYDLTEKLTATVGGRYFEYNKDEQQLTEGGLVRVPLGTGVTQDLRSDENDSSFKANLSYKPTQDSLLYASWSQGFRLGRPDVGAIPAVCDRNGDGLVDGTSATIESTRTIDSDFLDNYEVGAKASLFDRRLTIDSAIYHISWDGLPIRSVISASCGYTANVGAAESDGVEMQASVLVTKGLKVDVGGAYTRARLSKDAPGLPGAPKDGARLPGSPKVNANLGMQYEFDLAGHNTFVRADSFYVGKFYGDLLQSPLTEAGDYVKVDARAGMLVRKLSVELFVQNLTNQDNYTWRGLSNANSSFGFRLRPRTVGIQLGYSFE